MQQLQDEGETILLEWEQHMETAEEVMMIADGYQSEGETCEQTVPELEGETCDAADGYQTCQQMILQEDETCDAAD